MNRRDLLKAALLALLPRPAFAASVSTLIGNGSPGLSDSQVNNPYGVIIARDGGLYFCDVNNQLIRRFDFRSRTTRTIAGDGQRAYRGDGGPATAGSLNMPHEIVFDARGHMYIAERDSHVVRKVDGKTGTISTLAGTGVAGFTGDSGPAAQAQLRQPHSIYLSGDDQLLICDIGNQRIRAVDLRTGIIDTIGGTGERLPTPDGAPLKGTPLNGPRTMVIDGDGTIYLALREGNALYRIAPKLSGPKGLALSGRNLYVADTESHTIRCVNLDTGIITTVLGAGVRGDGPETDPLQCKLSRPHGLFAAADGTLYVTDSEAHRIRMLKP